MNFMIDIKIKEWIGFYVYWIEINFNWGWNRKFK